jgi:hypothetical protein
LIVAWSSALVLSRSREPRVVGTGAEEFRRIARGSLALFGSVAVISFLFELQVARGYLAVAFPLGLTGVLLTRWLWRQWLAKAGSNGRFIFTVLVVGSHKAAAHSRSGDCMAHYWDSFERPRGLLRSGLT